MKNSHRYLIISVFFFFIYQISYTQSKCSFQQDYAVVEVPCNEVKNIQLFYKNQSGNRYVNLWNVRQSIESQGKQFVFAMNAGMFTPPVTFQMLAEFMLSHACVNALYFDGSVSEMYCPQLKQWNCGSSFGVMVGVGN